MASHLPSPPPGQPEGRAPSASGAWGHLAPMPRRGGCPSFWEGPRPVRRRGAQVREGLGGRAGPPLPRGQRGRSRALVLRDEYLTSRRDPGQVPRTAWAQRGVGVSLVAREQWLMPQPKLLHLAPDGDPCSKRSAPCVPLPAPGGRLRCGATSGTLPGGARGGLLTYESRGGAGSRGRGK